MTDPPPPPPTSNGMSRAAKKKRAKKRRKEQQSKQDAVEHDKESSSRQETEYSAKKIKTEHEEEGDSPTTMHQQPLYEKGDEDEVIHGIVSKLTPAQILLLQDPPPASNDADDDGAVDLKELLQNEITSKQRARALLESLFETQVSLSEFYNEYWEKKPLLIKCTDKRRLENLFLTLPDIQTLLETQPLYYGKDLNVTRYDEMPDGVKRRITLDPESSTDDFVMADAKDVWTNYQEAGCTIRFLCPHQHSDNLHALLSTLELEWGCMVGSNVYLTPPHASQGFAPHYDDIEAFVLQLEGYKHWKVYAPLNKAEVLPRASSEDYTEKDMEGVEPVLDCVLGPGDLLYMPRGWIHQACTLEDAEHKNQHSLHVTISAMQQWSWVDFLELLLPEALETAAASDRSTREGLPLRFLDYMGAIHDDINDREPPEGLKQLAEIVNKEDVAAEDQVNESDPKIKVIHALRENFREEAKRRIMRISTQALSMLDAASDQIGKRFLSDRQPPAWTPAEAEKTSENRAQNGGKIWPNTLVRLARPGIARLALEEKKAVLYHCADNSRVYQGNPLSPMEFEMDDAPALETLLKTVEPHWIQVQDLLHDDIQDKMEIAQALYDEGILAILQTDKPDKSIR